MGRLPPYINPPAAKLGGEIRHGIQWTGHSELIRAHGDVGIDLGGGDVLMAQQGLNGSQVGSAFNEVGREGMTQSVAGDAFGDVGSNSSPSQGLVEDLGMEVVTTGDSAFRIAGWAGGREKPKPVPAFSGSRKLPLQPAWKGDAGIFEFAVFFPEFSDFDEMVGERRFEGFGNHRRAIFVTLGTPNVY